MREARRRHTTHESATDRAVGVLLDNPKKETVSQAEKKEAKKSIMHDPFVNSWNRNWKI